MAKTYTYDAAGNVTSDGLHAYLYDDRGRLVDVDAAAATYEHNGQGQRVRKIKPLTKLPVGVFPAKQKVYVAPDYAAENSARVGALLVHRGGSRYWHYGWG